MKLVVGLGNPGEKYTNTPHNVGFKVIDNLKNLKFSSSEWFESKQMSSLVCKESASGVILAKPTVFMNDSGSAVKNLIDFYKINTEDLYVIHDDLDIELGSFKILKGKGPKAHNGLISIYQILRTEDFWHVRVGVESRADRDNEPGAAFVLKKYQDEFSQKLEVVVNEVAGQLAKILPL